MHMTSYIRTVIREAKDSGLPVKEYFRQNYSVRQRRFLLLLTQREYRHEVEGNGHISQIDTPALDHISAHVESSSTLTGIIA